MSMLTISPENQARLAVAVPLVALGLSLFVVYPKWQSYGDLSKQIEQNKAELDTLKAQVVPEPGPVTPAVDLTPSEPAQFLRQITVLANQEGLSITGFDLTPGEARETGVIRPVDAKLDIDGQYYQFRGFLAQLARADRTFVVTDITITSQSSQSKNAFALEPAKPLHASITIERYVAVPERGA